MKAGDNESFSFFLEPSPRKGGVPPAVSETPVTKSAGLVASPITDSPQRPVMRYRAGGHDSLSAQPKAASAAPRAPLIRSSSGASNASFQFTLVDDKQEPEKRRSDGRRVSVDNESFSFSLESPRRVSKSPQVLSPAHHASLTGLPPKLVEEKPWRSSGRQGGSSRSPKSIEFDPEEDTDDTTMNLMEESSAPPPEPSIMRLPVAKMKTMMPRGPLPNALPRRTSLAEEHELESIQLVLEESDEVGSPLSGASLRSTSPKAESAAPTPVPNVTPPPKTVVSVRLRGSSYTSTSSQAGRLPRAPSPVRPSAVAAEEAVVVREAPPRPSSPPSQPSHLVHPVVRPESPEVLSDEQDADSIHSSLKLVRRHLEDQASENVFFRKGMDSERQRGKKAPPPNRPLAAPAKKKVAAVPPASSPSKEAAAPRIPPPLAPALEEAARSTKVWRRFNAAQRAEVERLKERISEESRRTARVSLERGLLPGERRLSASPTARRAFLVDMPLLRLSPTIGSSRPSLDLREAASAGKRVRYVDAAEKPRDGVRRSGASGGYATARLAIAGPSQPAAAHAAAAASHRRRVSASPALSPPVELVGRSPEAVVASVVGIHWPAARGRRLHFLNGTRLTREQEERFYEAVQLHAASSAVHREHIRAVFFASAARSAASATPSPVTSLSPCRESMGGRSSAAHSRSRVLREVFDLMQVKSPCDAAGTATRAKPIPAASLPMLKLLLENELCAVEKELMAGERCLDEPNLAFLLQTLEAQQERGSAAPATLLRGGKLLSYTSGVKDYLDGWERLREMVERFASSFQGARKPYEMAAATATWSSLWPLLQKQFQAVRRRALLLSFAVNIVIPLCLACPLGDIDFPSMAMVVFMAAEGKHRLEGESMLDSSTEKSDNGSVWRGVLNDYLQALSTRPDRFTAGSLKD